MYRVTPDPYCYPGTTVLKNRARLRNQTELDKFERFSTAKRAEEPLPVGGYDYRHYRAIHRHLFQDVYAWAGRIRTVRIQKGEAMFCYPEYINGKMSELFEGLLGENCFRDISSENFASSAAHFFAELNAIHPFREGNGRVQNIFLRIIADQAGHPLDFERLNPPDMLAAMIASFSGGEGPLADLLLQLMRVR